MDENQEQALNQEAEEINSRAQSPVAEQEAPEEVDSVESTEETQPAETVGDSKKGFSSRIRELNQRAKLAEEKAQSLAEKLAELTGSGESAPSYIPQGFNSQVSFNPQEPIVAPGEEIDVNELNRRIAEREQRLLQTSSANTELRLRQMEAITRINNDANAVLRDYPELDPDSDHFNKELSDSITEATDAYVKANPYNASVKKFVARLMKPYKGAIETEVGKASENIARQVSQAALRPTTVRKQEKTAGEKSIAELEAELGIVNS